MKKIFLSAWMGLFFIAFLYGQSTNAKPEPFSLDALQYRTFLYFWETTDTLNWQTPDRWPTLTFSSIAATGFGLSSYIVGVERGWITREQASDRVLKTLQVLKSLPQGSEASGISGYKGFYYHFLDLKNAHRFQQVELSSIDTGLLLMGILACQSYFDGDNPAEKTIRDDADFIYRRVEWDWMLNSNGRLSMGWHPEKGFITSEWSGYNEAMLLYILALGSPTHPIPDGAWERWCDTYYWAPFEGQEMLNFGALFAHQYSHSWINFRGVQDPYMREKGIDYFENSRRATLSNRAYCMRNPGKFKGYSDNVWGLTASDGPMDWAYRYDPLHQCPDIWNAHFEGYNARGAAADYLRDDGTIVPTAAGGSVPFAPEYCIPALKSMWEMYYDSLVGPYGFKDAFNPSFTACGALPNGWFDVDYLGIDQGPILLMIENYRTGLLWNIIQKNPYIVQGMKRAHFTGVWLNQSEPKVVNLNGRQSHNRGFNPGVVSDPNNLFEKNYFRSTHGPGLPYRLLRPLPAPRSLSGEVSKYPLIVFLHGSGERGNDNEAQLRNGVLSFVEAGRQEQYRAYVLAPQCPNGDRWAPEDWRKKGLKFDNEPTQAMSDLLLLIQQTIKGNPDIDTNRIYAIGLSMGGFGVFDLISRQPELFAAAIPMCGGGDAERIVTAKDMPIWVFHGQVDNVVPVEFSRQTVKALEALGGHPRYTEYRTLSHAIWQETMYDRDVLEWLFSQKKH